MPNAPTKMANFRLTYAETARLDLNAAAAKLTRTGFVRHWIATLALIPQETPTRAANPQPVTSS